MGFREVDHVDVVYGLKNSDEAVFRRVYDHYAPALYAYVFRFLKCPNASEEVVQETMLKLWETRHNLDEQYPVGPLLYTISRRIALNHLRKIANSRQAVQYFWDKISQGSNQTQEQLDVNEVKDWLQETLDSLPERQQLIFHMSRNEGYSHEEIAEKLNISKNTVKNHLVLALKQLRVQFKKVGIYCFTLLVVLFL